MSTATTARRYYRIVRGRSKRGRMHNNIRNRGATHRLFPESRRFDACNPGEMGAPLRGILVLASSSNDNNTIAAVVVQITNSSPAP